MTVGVNWSVSVASIVAALGNDERQVDGRFVPIVGSRGGTGTTNAHETSEGLARAFGCDAYHLPAPTIASTHEAARIMAAEPGIAETLDLAVHADISIVGIGVPAEDSYLVREKYLTKRGLAAVIEAGAVGDISARFFDADGRHVPVSYEDRIIGLTLEQHQAIPTRIAIAGGESKRAAILAAGRGALYNVLVTDVETGNWLVAQP
jgi:DNA-binding transcriptional regulator LsrR (DeoR family)